MAYSTLYLVPSATLVNGSHAEFGIRSANSSGVDCKTCFIASDNLTGVLLEAHATVADYFPQCTIQHIPDTVLVPTLGYDSPTFRGR